MCTITGNGHPVSILSRIYSSEEKAFTSINNISFDVINWRDTTLKATFVMNRGYDDNKMFLKPDELGQDYVRGT